MGSAAQLLYPPTVILAAFLFSRRWPHPTRRASRLLAAVNGLALLCIIATGWFQRADAAVAIHRWLPHGLLILDWSAIPIAIGAAAGRSGSHFSATVRRVMGLLILGVVLLLASVTGYLGPSHGPSDEKSLRRFQILHYWVWPMLAIVLVAWWYRRPTPEDADRPVSRQR